MAEPTKAVAIGLTNGYGFQQIRYGWHIGRNIAQNPTRRGGKRINDVELLSENCLLS